MSRSRRTELTPIRSAGTSWSLAAGTAVAMAVLVLAAVALLVDGTPDEFEQPAAQLPEVAVVADTAQDEGDAATASEEPVALPHVTTDIFLARDPFDPVVPEDEPEEPADAPRDPADPLAPTDPDDPTNGTRPVDRPPSPDRPADDPCYGDDELVCNGDVLTLIGIDGSGDDRVAEIQVGDTRYRVQPGDAFGGYVLGEFSNECVWVVIGDVSRRLCPEASLLK